MEPELFSSAAGEDAQLKFQRWQADNPRGFYINRKAASRGMLHRVGCGHLGDAGDWDASAGDVARRAKICHNDRASLLAWAEREGVAVTPCADCKP